MRTKTLVVFRSKSIEVVEDNIEPAHVPVPETILEPTVAMEEQIQSLATHGLLRPKMEVSWSQRWAMSSLPRLLARLSSSSHTLSVSLGSSQRLLPQAPILL
jgi:hypothetical protein